jgi:hypothetical protein
VVGLVINLKLEVVGLYQPQARLDRRGLEHAVRQQGKKARTY